MSSPLEVVQRALADHGCRGSGHSWQCPAHEDKRPSLSVTEGDDGRVLLNCHAGCPLENVVAALELTMSDLFPPRHESRTGLKGHRVSHAATPAYVAPSREPAEPLSHPEHGAPTAAFEVRNPNGSLFAVHARFDELDGGKRFAWWRSGKWGLDGTKLKDAPLYRSNRITAEGPIVITEGEKAANALADVTVGLSVLATVTGASSTPGAAALELLRQRDITLWPDHDLQGAEHMARIAAALKGVAKSVRTVDVAALGLPPRGDAVEWLEEHDAVDDVTELVLSLKALPAAEDDARPGILLRDVLATPATATEWIVGGVLAVGGIGILSADYYLGKSTLLALLIAHVAIGRSFLGFEVARALPVLYWQAEGSRRLFAERVACGCFHAGIDVATLDFAFPPADLQLPFESPDFARFVIDSGRKVVVADSLGYFHGGEENSATDWKKCVMKPLMTLSRSHGVSFLFAHHYVKPADNRQGRHKIRGTGAIGADCDLVMRLEAPDGELKSERRLIFDKVKDAAEQPALTLCFDKSKALFTREGVAGAEDEVGEKRRKLIANMKGRINTTLAAQPNLSGRQLFELTRGSRAIFDAALGEMKGDIQVIGNPGPRGSILWAKALFSAADRDTE